MYTKLAGDPKSFRKSTANPSRQYLMNHWSNWCRCQLQVSGWWDSLLEMLNVTKLKMFGTPVGNDFTFFTFYPIVNHLYVVR